MNIFDLYVKQTLTNPFVEIGILIFAIVAIVILSFYFYKIKKGNKNFKRIQTIWETSEDFQILHRDQIVAVIQNAFEYSNNSGIRYFFDRNTSPEKKISTKGVIKKFFGNSIEKWLVEKLNDLQTPNQLRALQEELLFSTYFAAYEEILTPIAFSKFEGSLPLTEKVCVEIGESKAA